MRTNNSETHTSKLAIREFLTKDENAQEVRKQAGWGREDGVGCDRGEMQGYVEAQLCQEPKGSNCTCSSNDRPRMIAEQGAWNPEQRVVRH